VSTAPIAERVLDLESQFVDPIAQESDTTARVTAARRNCRSFRGHSRRSRSIRCAADRFDHLDPARGCDDPAHAAARKLFYTTTPSSHR